jgi:hypothetical protein
MAGQLRIHLHRSPFDHAQRSIARAWNECRAFDANVEALRILALCPCASISAGDLAREIERLAQQTGRGVGLLS